MQCNTFTAQVNLVKGLNSTMRCTVELVRASAI